MSGVLTILPQPFAWITIPEGPVTIEGKTETIPAFDIAKYPLTNAQYAPFIKAEGYSQQQWWTEAGWQSRQQNNWTQPRSWDDSKWNGADYPVVGVSCYEAVAFCRWLAATTGEKIMLPTEHQWQRAARALPDSRDSGYAYPWGMDWDAARCNSNFGYGTGRTTPVTHYEGAGDSPLGVVDLSGNVWEWCRTTYYSGSNDLDATDVCVQRGGSWFDDFSTTFRADYRGRIYREYRNDYRGFRLSRE